MSNALRILVPVKRVIDYAVNVRVRKDLKGIEKAGVKHSMNPFDELSIEEAVRLRERKAAIQEIVAVSAGPAKCQEALRTAMAMGADRAIHIELSEEQAEAMEPLVLAKLLKAIAEKEKSNLVLLGKQAIDNDFGQTGPLLAGLGGGGVCVTREVDGGSQTVKAHIPMVIATDLRLNEPRYATLPSIMKAKKKKMEQTTLKDLGVEYTKRLSILKIEEPPKRKEGHRVATVSELMEKLREAGALGDRPQSSS
ncbi:electron transfer flavoprotein beta subunit [Trichoderma evansii]